MPNELFITDWKDYVEWVMVESPEHYKALTGKEWKPGNVKFQYGEPTDE